MVQRDPSHKQNSDGGELVPARIGPLVTELPLLPYERSLIAAVGMSEEEYVEYLRWVQRSNSALITQDAITADAIVVPSLILLAVGTLFTVAGALLQPKPKPVRQDQRQIKNETGDSKDGRSRFNPTFGFDSQTQLAEYGTAVAINWGKALTKKERESLQNNWPETTRDSLLCNECVRFIDSPATSGGLVVSPLLVWSRMYSMGKSQLFQGMYVVGEKLKDKAPDPDIAGVWIGNNTLDKLSDRNYAFYWDSIGAKGRIYGKNLLYGTQGDKASGNPFLAEVKKGYRDWNEPFPTPVCDMADSSGFSMTYSLSNQSTFGCYAPIMNGTDRRPPWRVISLPKSSDGDAEDRTKEERKKISGGNDRMEASGRGYGRLMALWKYEGKKAGSKNKPRWTEKVKKGDKVTFRILKREYKDDYYDEGVSMEDLINESETDRAAADDALQVGEEFMINSSRFRVVKRDKNTWRMDKQTTQALLECIEQRKIKSPQLGFVSEDYFERDVCNTDSKISVFEDQHVPPHWSPLLKYELAGFRNIRKAEVTEIGIKSRVWAQMNGMCNYPTIPTADELRDQYDKDDVTFTNGVQNQYFTRFSFFTLHMRKSEVSKPENPESFRDCQIIFAIRGIQPVDQYNYIRIKPEKPDQYEYRLYPLNSGWAARTEKNPKKWTTNDVAWVLDTAKGEEFTLVKNIKDLGKLEISGVGSLISVRCAVTSPLMLGKKDSGYKNDGNAWCPDEWCDGFKGDINKEDIPKGEAVEGLGDELEDTCQSDLCVGDFGFGEGRSQTIIKQEELWNNLPSPSEEDDEDDDDDDEIPDYIKDGLAHVGCVGCGDFRSTRSDIKLDCSEKCTKTFKEANGANYTFNDEGVCETRVEETRYDYDDDIENPEEFIDGVKVTKTDDGDYRVTAKWDDKTIFSKTFNGWNITGDEDGPDRDDPSNKNSSAARLRFIGEIARGSKKEDWLFRIGNCRKDCGKRGGDIDREATYGTEGVYAIQRLKGVYKGLAGEGDCGGSGGGGGGGGKNKSGCSKPYWAIFEYATQVNEGSYYAGLISRSCDSGAEHQIVYVNESKKPKEITQYRQLNMMGLSLRATRELNNLDQPRVYLSGGIVTEYLTEATLTPDFNVKAAQTLGATPRARPNKVKVKLEEKVKCDTKDRRILEVTASFVDEDGDGSIDPSRKCAKDITWMVQWFRGKNRNHNSRIKNPEWYDTSVQTDWSGRNPHAWRISGNKAKIRVPKESGWYTCYMWPAESNSTNNTSVSNESGLNFGKKENNDELSSLSGILWKDDDTMSNIFANGVKRVRNQRTDGSGSNTTYTCNYTYLWSNKDNYSSMNTNNKYVYWYEIDSSRAELEVQTGEICPGDTRPPGPGPFTAEIECGDGFTGSTLKCITNNCGANNGSVSYEWQYRPTDGTSWEVPPGPTINTNKTFTPGTLGYYRCKATCVISGSDNITKKTDQCFVNSSDFPIPEPPAGPIPDPPDDETPINPGKPNQPGSGAKGCSNNYADLIYWLLTQDEGVGKVVKSDMIDKDRMIVTAKYIKKMSITWDGTISEKTNLRAFASATAPFFLCNFTITNGKFTLWPVIPVNKKGEFANRKAFVKQIFTEGNIIDGTLSLDYLDADDRRPFKAAMRYRVMTKNQLPEERTLTTRWYTGKFSDPTEEFDMTQFCTTPEHALLAARYFMWVRNVVTHTVKFKTVPEVMNGVSPGDIIKLKLESAIVAPTDIGCVGIARNIQTADKWQDGTYEVNYWIAGMSEPDIREVTVKDNVIQEPGLEHALVSPRRRLGCDPNEEHYQVESIMLDEDGLVEITASYYPLSDFGIADLHDALFGLGRYSCFCGDFWPS